MAATSKLTKTQFIASVAEGAGVDKKSVGSVLDAIAAVAKAQLGADGPGEVTIPGLAKLKAKVKPATQDHPGVNPFTKEPTSIKGKPASRSVKAYPIKALKELA